MKAVNDDGLHSAKEVREIIEKDMGISVADLAEMLPSGKQRTFDNRVAWARTYLDKAGLIETPIRGKYRITKEGREALLSGKKIDLAFLERSESFKEFHNVNARRDADTIPIEQDETPDESPLELVESAY